MVYTRANLEAMFDHILVNLFHQEKDNPLHKALIEQGLNHESPSVLANLSDLEIEGFKYLDENNNPLPVPIGKRNYLKVFRDFVRYKASLHEAIQDTYEGWMGINREDFYNYQVSGYYPFQPPPTASTTTVGSGSP